MLFTRDANTLYLTDYFYKNYVTVNVRNLPFKIYKNLHNYRKGGFMAAVQPDGRPVFVFVTFFKYIKCPCVGINHDLNSKMWLVRYIPCNAYAF